MSRIVCCLSSAEALHHGSQESPTYAFYSDAIQEAVVDAVQPLYFLILLETQRVGVSWMLLLVDAEGWCLLTFFGTRFFQLNFGCSEIFQPKPFESLNSSEKVELREQIQNFQEAAEELENRLPGTPVKPQEAAHPYTRSFFGTHPRMTHLRRQARASKCAQLPQTRQLWTRAQLSCLRRCADHKMLKQGLSHTRLAKI